MSYLMVALGVGAVCAGLWYARHRSQRMRAVLGPLCVQYGGRIQQQLGAEPRFLFERAGARVCFIATAADPTAADATLRRGRSLVTIESDGLPEVAFRVETRDFLEDEARPAGYEPPPPGSAEFRRRFRCEGESHQMLRAVLTPARQVRLLQLHDRRRAIAANVRDYSPTKRRFDVVVSEELTDLAAIRELMELSLELHDAIIEVALVPA